MATYHVTVVPRPGEQPAPDTCPLSPWDITADSEEDALVIAKARIESMRMSGVSGANRPDGR
jgi:hypothetical protein